MTERGLENLKSIANTGNAEKCPFCGSEETDYKCSIVDQENRLGYMDIWCNGCKRAFHVSRMEISDGMKTDGQIPDRLVY